MFFNLDMTFIISLQLKDSIVITADKKEVVINEEEIDSFNYIMQTPKNKNDKKFCIEVFKQR